MSEKRISSHLKCPHCGRVSQKPAQFTMFAGARGVGFSSSSETPCPFCRRGISIQRILDGEYDHWGDAGTGKGCLIPIVVIIVLYLLIVKFC
jgi:hypothetical protein